MVQFIPHHQIIDFFYGNTNIMKQGYYQAKREIVMGLEPIFVWSLRPFWIGYNFYLLLNKFKSRP